MDIKKILINKITYSQILSKVTFYVARHNFFMDIPLLKIPLYWWIKRSIKINKGFPKTIIIENTNHCNSKCDFCPHSTMKRKKGVMNLDLFKKIIDECAENNVSTVSLSGFGEPLIDKIIFVKTKYAKQKGIPLVRFVTNGSLLTPEASKKLIDAGLDEISISLEGFEKETYEKYRKGLNFDTIMYNLKSLKQLRRDKKKPKIILTTIDMEEDGGNIKKHKKIFKDIYDIIFIKKLADWAGQKSEYAQDFVSRKIPCNYLWTHFNIAWNGDVCLCCRDSCECRVILGNVKQNSIKEIWHGSKYEKYRKAQFEGRDIFPCNECKYNPIWF
ncbi:MAG: radical SAM/SPASM domain-containing protein [Promethearchaeota archaeon]